MIHTRYSFMSDEEFLNHLDMQQTLSETEVELIKRWQGALAEQADQEKMYEEIIRKMGECDG